MTTPNIKALAERIKYLSEKGDWDFYEIQELTKLQGQAHVIASALLRLWEDAERLSKALSVTHRTYFHDPNCAVCMTMESHNKLMEELGNE